MILRYLPIDATGNWIYQSFDVATVYVLVKLVYAMHRNYKCAFLDGRSSWLASEGK